MRLIDADEFIVEQMKITRLSETIWQEGYWAGVDDTIGDIGKAPTIEAEPVVRCKYCKHGEIDDPDFPDQYCCHAQDGWNKGDFYCAYGERRDGDD